MDAVGKIRAVPVSFMDRESDLRVMAIESFRANDRKLGQASNLQNTMTGLGPENGDGEWKNEAVTYSLFFLDNS